MAFIITPRLALSIAEPDDAQALADAYNEIAGNPFWQMPALSTTEGALEIIGAWLTGHKRKRERFFIIRHETRIIGGAGLQPTDGEDGHYNISYWIRTSEVGRGYATEAANALTRYAFTALKARSVSIAYEAGNQASRRVIAKLGFKRYAQEIKPDGSTAEIFRRTDLRGLHELVVDYSFL